MSEAGSVVATSKDRNQVQQVYKQIEDVEVQAYRRANVVGLTAMNNPTGIKQD